MNNVVTDRWDVDEINFPTNGTPAEKLHFFLRYAVLAPSRYNTQPWRFKVQHDTVELYADTRRALRVLDPLDRELIIGCGAALVFLRLAIAHFGYTARVTTFPDPAQPDLLARVMLGHRGAVVELGEEALFHAILQRRTNRRAFSTWPVPESVLQAVEGAAATHGAWLQVIRGAHQQQAGADLITEGERLAEADPAFVREQMDWVRPGSTAPASGISRVGPTLVTEAAPAYPPTLVVLGTPADLPPYWLIAGEALGRVLLRACTDGVSAWFLNQPIEHGVLRLRLMALLGHRGFPQVLLRLGYGPAASPTPRRAVEDVLL
jgi:nitroreductase